MILVTNDELIHTYKHTHTHTHTYKAINFFSFDVFCSHVPTQVFQLQDKNHELADIDE